MLFDNSPYMQAWEETHGGSRFTFIRVGDGVSVIPIRRNSLQIIEIALISETRLETTAPILKAVGGYLRGRPQEEAARQFLKEEAGIACERLYLLLSRMEGFTTVELPIATYLALKWRVIAEAVALVRTMTLDEAVNHVLAQEIPDQCNADAIMRIALLEARNHLPI